MTPTPPNATTPETTRPSAPASKPRTLEERLGAHWTVWIGGLALALGAVLLVRYSIERGFFGPGMRIALGALLAAAPSRPPASSCGERMSTTHAHPMKNCGSKTASTERNSLRAASSTDLTAKDLGSPAGPFATPYIPGVLTASGTIAAFATIYSAHAVYGFIGPAASFLALGLVAIATMAAAWVHGPALAGLGLVGALATPLLVESENASAWPVIAYDLVVVASAYGLARLKRWPWLATAAAIGAVLWALPFIAQVAGSREHEPLYAALTHIALQLGLAAYALAIVPHRGRPDQEARIDPLAHGVLGAFALLAILALGVVPPSLFGGGWIIGALLVAALLAATAIRSASACGGAALAGLVILAALWLWPKASGEAQDVIRLAQADAPFPFSTPPMLLDTFWRGVPAIKPLGFAAFAILAGAGVALAAIRRLREGADLPMRVAAIYAGAASLTPLVSLAIAYLRFARHEASLLLALIACLTGLGFARRDLAIPQSVSRPRERRAQARPRRHGGERDRRDLARPRLRARRRHADRGLGARRARHGLRGEPARSFGASLVRRRARRSRRGAHLLRAPHHRQRLVADADLQLAALRLWRAGGRLRARRTHF